MQSSLHSGRKADVLADNMIEAGLPPTHRFKMLTLDMR
jgi:hypothetical protein